MTNHGAAAPTYHRAPIFPRIPSWERIKASIGRKLVRWRLDMQPEGNLVSFARKELELAGLFDGDSDYSGMMGEAVIDMQKLFSMEGHSGFSAGMAVSLFEKVSRFEPLTPLTGEDDEWMECYDGVYQNKRCSHVFKEYGQAYDSNGRVFREPSGSCYTSRGSRVSVTFPYVPTIEYVDAPASGEGDQS